MAPKKKDPHALSLPTLVPPKPKQGPPADQRMAMTGPMTWAKPDGGSITGPDWFDSSHIRYGPSFAESMNVPNHYSRRPRRKDAQFFGVSKKSCEFMRCTRPPPAGVNPATAEGLSEVELRNGVAQTAQKVEMVGLFFNWTGAFGQMTNDQNKRLQHILTTSSKPRQAVQHSLGRTVRERDDLTRLFGQKHRAVAGIGSNEENTESKEARSMQKRAQHLYKYVTNK